jgi:hypothetical protein
MKSETGADGNNSASEELQPTVLIAVSVFNIWGYRPWGYWL